MKILNFIKGFYKLFLHFIPKTTELSLIVSSYYLTPYQCFVHHIENYKLSVYTESIIFSNR